MSDLHELEFSHRIAAELDREIELVAGVFSSDAERSKVAGANYRIDFSEDLIHWGQLREVLNHSGPLQISDPAANGHPHRFYRCVPLP